IVHVREDRRNGADVVFSGVFAGRFGCRRSGTPGGRVKMFDKNLVDAIVGEKDPGGKVLDCGSAELSVNLGLTIDDLTRGHGSLLLDLSYFRAAYNTVNQAAQRKSRLSRSTKRKRT